MLGSVLNLLWQLIAKLQLEVNQKLWEIPKKAHKYSVKHLVKKRERELHADC